MIFTREQMLTKPKVYQKDSSGELKEIMPMDDPVISPYPFIYFTCDRDPSPTDATYSGYPGLIYFWYNTSSTNVFCCTDCSTEGALVWQEMTMPQNILSQLQEVGWEINTYRSYSDESSLGFNTSRQPSTTNDTFVSISVTLANTVLTTSTVQIQISADDVTYTTIATIANLTETLNSNTYSMTFIVPSGYLYQLITSGTGTQTLINLQELSL